MLACLERSEFSVERNVDKARSKEAQLKKKKYARMMG